MSQISVSGSGGGGGGGLTTLTGDTGGAVNPSASNINVVSGLSARNSGASVSFSGAGSTLTFNTTDAKNNVFLGISAGTLAVTGFNNTSTGSASLFVIGAGNANCAYGVLSMAQEVDGSNNCSFGFQSMTTSNGALSNCAFGDSSLNTIVDGAFNCCFGDDSGTNLSADDSSNIMIGNNGLSGDNHTIRIGNQGTGDRQQNLCFIAGIFGATVNVGTGLPAVVDSVGKLGTVVSSVRFKENIHDLADSSEDIFNLRPVTFNYKEDESKTQCVGLIAEEVNEVMPSLAVIVEGEPFAVKYQDLPVLLLNELKKQRQFIGQLTARIQVLEGK